MTDVGHRPLIVLSGDALGESPAVAADLRASGFRVRDGFGPGNRQADRVVRHGVVASEADAAAAVLAALDGQGLLVDGTAAPETILRLVDDLRRIGQVDHRVERARHPHDDTALDATSLALLRLLAAGHTLGTAASELGISRRTADRRLADARIALKAERTTQAIATARRVGLLDG